MMQKFEAFAKKTNLWFRVFFFFLRDLSQSDEVNIGVSFLQWKYPKNKTKHTQIGNLHIHNPITTVKPVGGKKTQ